MAIFLKYYAYYLFYTFLGYPLIVRTAIVLIMISALFFLAVLVSLGISKRRHSVRRKIQQRFRKDYLDQITQVISDPVIRTPDEIEELVQCDVKKLKNREKRILTNIILHEREERTKKDEFVNHTNYLHLLDYFTLRKFWEGKLQRGTLASRQRALRKLDDMDVEIQGSIISALTYSRNRDVRKKARVSYMYFSQTSPFKFLSEDFDRTFNDWDKIELHRTLARRPKGTLPMLSQWVRNSKNIDFQCFMLNEISFFKQEECIPYLLELLVDTQEIELRRHVIDALAGLNYKPAEEQITKDYILQPQLVQWSVIRAVDKLQTGKSLPFLEEAYKSSHDNESKLLILQAIYNYGTAGRLLFHSMREKATDKFSKLSFDHVSNPLINQLINPVYHA